MDSEGRSQRGLRGEEWRMRSREDWREEGGEGDIREGEGRDSSRN